jgi:hypothetical protein
VFDPFGCPIIINVRDRLADLRALVQWLEDAGYRRIVLLDNRSTFPPLLDYLRDSPHEVVRLSRNCGSRAPWMQREWQRPAGWFVYTDCDVLPTEDCPTDLVAHLHELLERHPTVPKAGPGLLLDDVPAGLPSLEWERSLVSPEREIEPGVFTSLIDTTMSLYRPSSEFDLQAIRTGGSYQVRHQPWYRRSFADLAPDDAYYLEHADRALAYQGTTWEPA